MIKEIFSFMGDIPQALKLQKELDKCDFYQVIMKDCDDQGFAEWRKKLVDDLSGEILEIGCGTGLMFQYYNKNMKLTAIDIDQDYLSYAERIATELQLDISFMCSNVENLPFDDNSFDVIIVVLSLCSVDNLSKGLSEMKRVLRPGGEIRALEHVRSDKWLSAALMNVFNPLWLYLNKMNCNMNRLTVEEVQTAGFDVYHTDFLKIFSFGTPAFPTKLIKAKKPL